MKEIKRIISQEEEVGLRIYKYNRDNQPIYFAKLTSELNISRATIKKAIDKLLDLGMLDAEWTQDEKGAGWVRSLKITGEYTKFFEKLYEYTNSDS